MTIHAEAQWEYEHGTEFQVPDRILQVESIRDFSWHNDTCPSFGVEVTPELLLRIWVEHPDPDVRQSGTQKRFNVCGESWSNEAHAILLAADVPNGMDGDSGPETDDPDEAVRIFMDFLTKIRLAKAIA